MRKNNSSVRRFTWICIVAILLAVCTVTAASADVAVRFVGTAVAGDLANGVANKIARVSERAGIDLSEFACFEGDLQDLESGIVIGRGVDCLRPFNDAGDGNGAGIELEAYTFFLFEGGTLVSNGLTTVRPFFEGTGDADGGVTHLTGSIPAAPGGIVAASPAFKSWVGGSARLSGAVDLTNLGDGVIFFSCLFVLSP